jgi:hypothetical protein
MCKREAVTGATSIVDITLGSPLQLPGARLPIWHGPAVRDVTLARASSPGIGLDHERAVRFDRRRTGGCPGDR